MVFCNIFRNEIVEKIVVDRCVNVPKRCLSSYFDSLNVYNAVTALFESS